jgi:hypothetical protein
MRSGNPIQQDLIKFGRHRGFQNSAEAIFFLSSLDAGELRTEIGGASHARIEHDGVGGMLSDHAEKFGFGGNFAATNTPTVVGLHG